MSRVRGSENVWVKCVSVLLVIALSFGNALAGLPGTRASGGRALQLLRKAEFTTYGAFPHGVAFTKPAEGDFVVLDVEYDEARPDGQRLILKVREKSGQLRVVPVDGIYDWMLVPMTGVVNSPYDSLVTLDKALQHHFEARFHPDLLGTAVATRVLQSDLAPVAPVVAAGTPTKTAAGKGGKERSVLHLEAGERRPSIPEQARQERAREITKLYIAEFRGTYTITDSAVRASIADGRVKLAGQPYWRFSQVVVDNSWKLARDLAAAEEAAGGGQKGLDARMRIINKLPVVEAKDVSKSVSDAMNSEPPNTHIHASLTRIMHTSAILRMAEAQVPPAEWNAFVTEVAAVKIDRRDEFSPRFIDLEP